ncbi:MAG: DUF5020 family protein, partial [Bacteroidales bacterium]|nr:DUF5020 family protein [Bacteroidales bacterium]
YAGGLGVYNIGEATFGYNINNTWMFGAEYFFHSKDYRNTLTVALLYKEIFKKEQMIPMQISLVWGMQDIFNVKGLRFDGFADFWWERNIWADEILPYETNFSFITEPQIWYNVGQFFNCPNLSVGGEVEMSYNFSGLTQGKRFYVNPCLGDKWEL